MNILALLTDGLGAGGGIARYNRDLLAALAASHRVREISVLPRFGDAGAAAPAKVHQHAACRGRGEWVLRAVALAARQPVDAVLCGHLYAVPLAAAIARLRRVPLWVQVHGTDAWEPLGALHRRSLSAAHRTPSGACSWPRRRGSAVADPGSCVRLPQSAD